MIRFWLCWAGAAVILCGCTATAQQWPSSGLLVIPGVPEFQAQTRGDDCAGVALASLLAHSGLSASPADIDAAVHEPKLGGSLLPDLERFAASTGAKPSSGRGTLEEVRQLLHAGRPVLVPIDLGWSIWRRPHYVVLFGCGDEAFLMHVRCGETRTMSSSEFARRWNSMGRLYLYLES